jgi:ketosteroid isomerase-like protein
MTKANVQVIEGIYDAFSRGDIGAVMAAMAPNIVWNEAENFPYADRNPYVGPEAIVQGVFARIGAEWDGFAVNIDEILDAGDKVVACGRYKGTVKRSGKPVNAQIVHIWTVENGKAASFQQYADTLQVARAMEP